MYLDAVTELATWFRVMDHTNYARWILFICKTWSHCPQPEIAREFEAGNFTIQKRVDSSPSFQSTRPTSKTMLQSKETEVLRASPTIPVTCGDG